MEIIRVKKEHIEVLAPLFDSYRKTIQGTSDLEATREFLHQITDGSKAVTFLAIDGGAGTVNGLGFVNLYPCYSSIALKRIWILNDLYVGPHARGKNVAKNLIEQALRWAKETGGIRIELKTAVDNLKAQKLYRSIGFQVDEEHFYYRVPV